MKSEAEIRKHRDALRVCMKKPCDCAGTRHELGCKIGLRMMAATVDTLSWLLDENPDMDRLVENIAAGASEVQR